MLSMLSEKQSIMKKTSTLFIGAIVLTIAINASAQETPTPPAEVQPDIVLKADRESEAVGDGIYGSPVGQSIRVDTVGFRPLRFGVALQNDDEAEDSEIRFRASTAGRLFDVRYTVAGENVTAQLLRGTSFPVAFGESVQIVGTGIAQRRTRGRAAKSSVRYVAGSGALHDSAAVGLLKKSARKER
jgi:hypothetical protein